MFSLQHCSHKQIFNFFYIYFNDNTHQLLCLIMWNVVFYIILYLYEYIIKEMKKKNTSKAQVYVCIIANHCVN